MRTLLYVLGVLCSYCGTSQDQLITDPEVNTQILDSNEASPYERWMFILSESECLSDSDLSVVERFLVHENPISVYEIQTIHDIDTDKLRCSLKALLEQENELPLPSSGPSHFDAICKVELSKMGNISVNTPSLLLRTRLQLGPRYSIGLTYEKDREEALFHGKKGPAFLSGHLKYQGRSRLFSKAILGDYKLRIGQGLLINNYFRQPLSLSHNTIPKMGISTADGYTSVDENRALRGVAVLGQHQSFSYLLFSSYRQLDANIERDSILSLNTSGLHVSDSQINNKNATGHVLAGIHLNWTNRHIICGATAMYIHMFDAIKTPEDLYNYIKPRNQQSTPVSLDINWRIKSWKLFGEVALSNKNVDLITGMLWSPHRNHKMAVLFRDIKPQPIYALQQTLAHATTGNEIGLYLGYLAHVSKLATLNAEVDHRINKSWSYLNSPQREATAIRGTLRFYKRKHWEAYLKASHLIRAKDTRNDIGRTSIETKSALLIHYRKIIESGIEWRSRVQLTRYSFMGQSYYGWMLYQELKYKPISSPFSLTARIARFHTDHFENRHYAYEVRPGGLFAIPAYSGSSTRFLMNCSYKLSSWQLGCFLATNIAASIEGEMGLTLKKKI